jgi:hypothetical protein
MVGSGGRSPTSAALIVWLEGNFGSQLSIVGSPAAMLDACVHGIQSCKHPCTVLGPQQGSARRRNLTARKRRNLCSCPNPLCIFPSLHIQDMGVSTVAHLVVEHIHEHNVVPLGLAIRVQECKRLIPRLANCDSDGSASAFCRISIRPALLHINRQECQQQEDFSLLPRHNGAQVDPIPPFSSPLNNTY